jgi:hypothetical protein
MVERGGVLMGWRGVLIQAMEVHEGWRVLVVGS